LEEVSLHSFFFHPFSRFFSFFLHSFSIFFLFFRMLRNALCSSPFFAPFLLQVFSLQLSFSPLFTKKHIWNGELWRTSTNANSRLRQASALILIMRTLGPNGPTAGGHKRSINK
jgi:hypothetical protein